VRGGQLRDRARLQQDSSNTDDPTPTWTGTPVIKNYPCNIQAVGGDETYRGRQLETHVDYVVEGRFFDGITSKMRWYVTAGFHKGKTLNINHVREFRDHKGRRLEMYCTELEA
jgi:head-tail adaptor